MTNTESILLPYQAPWDWQQFHAHFRLRAIAGQECLGERDYCRSFRLGKKAEVNSRSKASVMLRVWGL